MRPRVAADPRRESGAVLAMVLILALLLSFSIVSFQRRTLIDTLIVRNRDAASRAEALARGGIHIATGILLQDAFASAEPSEDITPGSTYRSLWARLGRYRLTTSEGDELRITIEDSGSRLNLNALVPYGGTEEESEADAEAEEFLVALFDKIIDEIPLPPGEKFYDSRELARALIDYLDSNEDSALGGFEDDWYQQQNPPYRAANRPLLSVEELALVRGFDSHLMAALRPYVTVYPLGGIDGINLNTAPPHVLAAVYYGAGGDMRLADEDIVGRLLELREQDQIACSEHGQDPKRCVRLSEVDAGLGEGALYPPVALPAKSRVFTVHAEARVGSIRRSILATIDRESGESGPQLLSWQMR